MHRGDDYSQLLRRSDYRTRTTHCKEIVGLEEVATDNSWQLF
jgi:hypothetical protein